MNQATLEQRLKTLTAKSERVNLQIAKLEKEEAIKEDRFNGALKTLKDDFGIDATGMKRSELEDLLAQTLQDLEAKLDDWEKVVAEADRIIQEFQEGQG